MIKEKLKIFKALCDETRYNIVKLLLAKPRCVCEIVPLIDRTQSTISTQLSKLENLGIVESKRDGKNVIYKIVNNKVKKIIDIIEN